MSLTQYTPGLVLGAYATITAYTLITIWMDENLSRRARLGLSWYAPTAYFVFYIMDLVQLTAIARCLVRTRSLLRRRDVGSTWASPERAGRAAAADAA
jgi:hypothetical protein